MKALFALVALCCATSAWADIGTVSTIAGDPGVITRGNNKLSGAQGSPVNSNDVYSTNKGIANITFKDDTKVKINENSRLVIDDFVYDPKNSDAGKLAMKVGLGTVRYASGQVAKTNPQQVAIKTPTATVAVRGTDFSMTVDESGQSLVMLLPSCKDEKDVKQYELQENVCRTGKIEVETMAGKVVLEHAFEATYVTSAYLTPTRPAVINTIEAKVNNNLILVKPFEVVRAINAQTGKTQREKEMEEAEQDQVRRMNEKVAQTEQDLERARVLALQEYLGQTGCNPYKTICVAWDKPDAPEIQSKGKGIAYRITENEHYAEVKTQGYSSNTLVSITQNDDTAYEVIGSGDPGGNVVTIKQNSGVLKRR